MYHKRESVLFHYLKRKIYDYVLSQKGCIFQKNLCENTAELLQEENI